MIDDVRMKVRIGGPWVGGGADQVAAAVDLLEQARVESLWLPEMVYSPLVEPFAGMTFALSRTRRLKAGGGIWVLPGRHPVLVASGWRRWPGWRPGGCCQCSACGRRSQPNARCSPCPAASARRVRRIAGAAPAPADRGDGVVPRRVLGRGRRERRAAAGQPAGHLAGRLGYRRPPAGGAPGRRWLGSLLAPAEAGPAVAVIDEAAADAGRAMEDDHFGLSLPVALDGVPDRCGPRSVAAGRTPTRSCWSRRAGPPPAG